MEIERSNSPSKIYQVREIGFMISKIDSICK